MASDDERTIRPRRLRSAEALLRIARELRATRDVLDFLVGAAWAGQEGTTLRVGLTLTETLEQVSRLSRHITENCLSRDTDTCAFLEALEHDCEGEIQYRKARKGSGPGRADYI